MDAPSSPAVVFDQAGTFYQPVEALPPVSTRTRAAATNGIGGLAPWVAGPTTFSVDAPAAAPGIAITELVIRAEAAAVTIEATDAGPVQVKGRDGRTVAVTSRGVLLDGDTLVLGGTRLRVRIVGPAESTG